MPALLPRGCSKLFPILKAGLHYCKSFCSRIRWSRWEFFNQRVDWTQAKLQIGQFDELAALSRNRFSSFAIRVLKVATERQVRRYDSAPGNRTAAYYLALLYVWSADCHVAVRDLPASLRNRLGAAEIFARLAAASPTTYEYRYGQASNLSATGEVMAAMGDYAGARRQYREGLQIAESLPKGPSMLDPAALIALIRAADSRATSQGRAGATSAVGR